MELPSANQITELFSDNKQKIKATSSLLELGYFSDPSSSALVATFLSITTYISDLLLLSSHPLGRTVFFSICGLVSANVNLSRSSDRFAFGGRAKRVSQVSSSANQLWLPLRPAKHVSLA